LRSIFVIIMKPFVLLQTRPETAASDNEYEAFLKFGNLKPNQLLRYRVEGGEVPKLDLRLLSGIMLGGGPYCTSDPAAKKSTAQRKCEAGLFTLVDGLVRRDFPFLGACYGIGVVATQQGGMVAKENVEVIGAYRITQTHAGIQDKLLAGLPPTFLAYSGHKEACIELPEGATLLASSQFCPIHMFRIKENVYVTQFHPELDAEGVEVRVEIYKDYGYFPAEDADRLIAEARAIDIDAPLRILRNFTKTYSQKK
jgi:GMP synthase (glutamine-hydrolysing)